MLTTAVLPISLGIAGLIAAFLVYARILQTPAGEGRVKEIAVNMRGQARAATAVDIGINQVTDADGNSRIVGDADTGDAADVASWTTPLPGGVGPVTVAMLMRNAAIAFEKKIELGWV